MRACRRIACLTLLDCEKQTSGRVILPDGEIEWVTYQVPPDLDQIRRHIDDLLKDYDAVALEGLSYDIRLGKETYRHEHVYRKLQLERYGDRISDGSGLRSTLERYLIKEAADKLRPFISGKKILFFSGLNRYGAAEVLSNYTHRMLFGDMLYGFRLGIPIYYFDNFITHARNLAKAMTKTPANWFWPSTKRTKPITSRFHRYFRRADVIVGGISYFKRYMPKSLKDKVVFTTIHGDEDIDLFAQRGVRFLVSLTPVVDDKYVPLPVLEAGLKFGAEQRTTSAIEDFFLDKLQAMDLQPHIIDLTPEGSEDFALIEVPERPIELIPEIPPVPAEDLSPVTEANRFCFVIHPLSFKYVERLRSVRMLRTFLPKFVVENIIARVKPWKAGLVRNIESATGAKAEGLLYALPMTSRAIMRFKPEFMYDRLHYIAVDAEKQGCRIMGLGAYTSVAGDAGVTVSKTSPIGVTTGNSYTVASTLLTLERAAVMCGIDISQSDLLVIGATGSIGAICARLAAQRVKNLFLVSPKPEKLLDLARKIEKETPKIKGRIRISRNPSDFTHIADGIITTTSSVDPVININELKPGCLVLDVARPPDIKPDVAATRQDVLVIESGEIKLPDGAEVTIDIGLPQGTIYACLAETMILALEGRTSHFTLGREIEIDRVNLIAEMGKRHGIELAAISSFGQAVPDELFQRMRRLNREKFVEYQSESGK